MFQLSDRQKEILQGKICPYCGQNSQFVNSSVVYGGEGYGMIYYCAPCMAYIGVSKGTDKALGRLANKELRMLKIEAQHHFYKLWREGFMTEMEAYQWLSETLGLPADYANFDMFSEVTCKKVSEMAQKLYTKLQNSKVLYFINLFRLEPDETRTGTEVSGTSYTRRPPSNVPQCTHQYHKLEKAQSCE